MRTPRPAGRPVRRPVPRPAEAGFSLLELVISMLIAVEILIAAALAFDLHNRMAQVQVQITDMQQSMRVAQYDLVRMLRTAGRGGLPLDLDPDAVFNAADPIPALRGMGIEVRNNVEDDDRHVARGVLTSPQAIEGTDILTVRGCVAGSVYQVDPSTFNPDADENGVADEEADLTILRTSLAGILQSLGPLVDEIQAYADGTAVLGRLALVSPTSLQSYAVADVKELAINGDAADPDSVVVTLDLNNNSPLNPLEDGVRQYPTNMEVASACLLEEYRYYVREVAGDDLTPLRPRLTRARFEPGTEQAYLGDASNYALDLADGIFDLQVALGLDTDYKLNYVATEPGSFNDDSDWIGDDDAIYEAAAESDSEDRTQDDWLYNDPGDDPTDPQYTVHAYGTNAGEPVQIYYVRISTAARTSRPDPGYRMPEFDTRDDGDWIEDHDYDSAPASDYKTGSNANHRRRVLQTVVDMRNI